MIPLARWEVRADEQGWDSGKWAELSQMEAVIIKRLGSESVQKSGQNLKNEPIN